MEYKNFGYLNLADEDRGRHPRKKKQSEFVHVLLFYVLPFIAINAAIFFIATAQPRFDVEIVDPGTYDSADIQVRLKSVFPRKEFSVLLDDEELALEEAETNLYCTTVDRNGTLTVSVTNINGMNKTVYENISCIDDEPPMITENDSAEGFVSLYIDDSQAGVNFGSVYAVDSDGNIITPALLDEGEGLVVFNYDTPSIEVHVFDNAGKESIATFTQGTEEGAEANGAEPEQSAE